LLKSAKQDVKLFWFGFDDIQRGAYLTFKSILNKALTLNDTCISMDNPMVLCNISKRV